MGLDKQFLQGCLCVWCWLDINRIGSQKETVTSRLESHEDELEPHKDRPKSMFVLAASDNG